MDIKRRSSHSSLFFRCHPCSICGSLFALFLVVSYLVTQIRGQEASSPDPITLSTDKTYLIFSAHMGNLNNQLNNIINVMYSLYKSPHRDSIRVVIPRTKQGVRVFGELFENTLGFDYVDYNEFRNAFNVRDILYGASLYSVSDDVVKDTRQKRFSPAFGSDFWDYFRLKAVLMEKMSQAGCDVLEWVDLAYSQCLQDGKGTCKAFLISPPFTNMHNCTAESSRYQGWTKFYSQFFNVIPYFKNAVRENLSKMTPPVLALHMRFLPYGLGSLLYREPYGSWKEGDLPNGFSIPLFINRSRNLYKCLIREHGWEMPKSIYILGWPKLADRFKIPFESIGVKTYQNSIPGVSGYTKIMIDEYTAIEADYFHSSFRSTLTLIVAQHRVFSKPQNGAQYLPDCLPGYGMVYNVALAQSICTTQQVEPQHVPGEYTTT